MKSERVHKTEVSLNLIVRRSDGSIKERRSIQPEPSKPDMLELVVRNPGGEVVSQKRFPVRSYVQNYSEALYHAMQENPSHPTLKDTSGTIRTEQTNSIIALEAADDSDVYGIWVGTGDTAVAVSDYTLATKVNHGTGAGQLDYSAMAYVAVAMDGTDIVYKAYRTFVNSSGGTITIKEVGLVATSTFSSHPYLILRDVEDEDAVTIDVAVTNGQTLTVTYIFTQTQASWFSKQYLQIMESMNFNHSVTLKRLGGSDYSRNFRSAWTKWIRIDSGVGVNSGVVVGTDDSALDSTSYQLGARISHGTGVGQLSHAAVTNEEVAAVGDDVTFVFKRTFTNNSGADITIKEAGVYRIVDVYSYLLMRSLTGDLVLEDGESVTAEFPFKHTV